MKKYLGAMALALLLAGCRGDDAPSAGVYLVDDIKVVFNQDDDGEEKAARRSLQEGISNSIKALKDDIYFSYSPEHMDFYTAEGKQAAALKQGRMQINGVGHTLTAAGKDRLQLVSDKKLACGFYDCEITLTLKKTDDSDPALVAIKQQFAQIEAAHQARLAQEKETLARQPLADFPGLLFSPADPFVVKLPIDVYQGLRQWNSGFYVRHMGKVLIDKEQEGTLIYTYDDRPRDTHIDLLVARGGKDDFDLTTWLSGSKGVLSQSENGALYYNQQGQLEALYFQYDAASQRYFFALANAPEIAPLAAAFSVLRTMDERHRGELRLSMDDIALSRQALEAKYQVNIEQALDVASIHNAITKKRDEMLEKPARFIQRSASMRPVRITLAPDTLRREIYVTLSSDPVSRRMADAQREKPRGKRVADIFIAGDEGEETYDYYADAGNGLTLQLTVPYDVGNPLQRMMLLHVFRRLDLSHSPVIPASERANLFKYASDTFADVGETRRFFVIRQGLLDSAGNLIVNNPADGHFEFEFSAPYIVAQKWRTEGSEGSSRRMPDGYVFDEKGKQLLHSATFDKIVGQRWAIGGDGDRVGLYDLHHGVWSVKPSYAALSWYQGVFIATHADATGGGASQHYSLLASDGRVLTKGSSIEPTERKDRIIVIGDRDNVSLFDSAGNQLFTRSGSVLIYLSEVDAYGVRDRDPASNENRVGVVSERGEVIFPVVYGGLETDETHLKMQSPDGQRWQRYEFNTVKDWRHHQPLQEAPAAQ